MGLGRRDLPVVTLAVLVVGVLVTTSRVGACR